MNVAAWGSDEVCRAVQRGITVVLNDAVDQVLIVENDPPFGERRGDAQGLISRRQLRKPEGVFDSIVGS